MSALTTNKCTLIFIHVIGNIFCLKLYKQMINFNMHAEVFLKYTHVYKLLSFPTYASYTYFGLHMPTVPIGFEAIVNNIVFRIVT